MLFRMFLLLSFGTLFACQTLFVANTNNNTVSLVNLTTTSIDPSGTASGTFVGPRELAMIQNGQYALVTNQGGDSLGVIDTATNAVVNTISLITPTNPAPVTPISVVANQTHAYVASNSNSTLVVVELATGSVSAVIDLMGGNANELAFTPDGSQVWVVKTGAAEVAVVDVASNTLVTLIPTGGATPNGIAIRSQYAYVVNQGSNDLSKIDLNTYTVQMPLIALAGVAMPQDIVISPDGTIAYIVDLGSNMLHFYSMATDSIIGAVALPVSQNYGVAISPDGANVFISHYTSNQISSYNVSTGIVTTSAALFDMPIGLAFYCPNQINGFCEKDVFLTQIELTNIVQWNPILSSIPLEYVIFRNGTFIGTAPGAGPYQYADPKRKKTTDFYTVYARTSLNFSLVGAIYIKSCK